jgi:hypothetical protein
LLGHTGGWGLSPFFRGNADVSADGWCSHCQTSKNFLMCIKRGLKNFELKKMSQYKFLNSNLDFSLTLINEKHLARYLTLFSSRLKILGD